MEAEQHSHLVPRSDIIRRCDKLFCLNICLANDLAIMVILFAQKRGEIRAA
jgi:hypothetical protein